MDTGEFISPGSSNTWPRQTPQGPSVRGAAPSNPSPTPSNAAYGPLSVVGPSVGEASTVGAVPRTPGSRAKSGMRSQPASDCSSAGCCNEDERIKDSDALRRRLGSRRSAPGRLRHVALFRRSRGRGGSSSPARLIRRIDGLGEWRPCRHNRRRWASRGGCREPRACPRAPCVGRKEYAIPRELAGIRIQFRKLFFDVQINAERLSSINH